MSSGGSDPPQLPRGLIGRRGTPSGKGARLPSIKGPRDLTLGGVQKKVFTPTIPARRTKTEGSGDAPSTSKQAESKPKPSFPSSDRGHGKGDRGRGDRGRGRGRGRGREANIIQTHSLFEQGPAEKMFKPSVDRSDYVGSGGVRSSSGGGAGGGRPTVKRERSDVDTKQVLDHLLKDDFISGLAEQDEDVCEIPVKLPLEIKSDIKREPVYTKVKVKDEPMEVSEDVKPVISNLADIKSDIPKKEAEKFVTCSELFTDPLKTDEGQLLFFQFPDTLPGLPATTEEEFRGKKEKAEKKEEGKQEEELAKKLDGCSLAEFNEGLIGKLVVRKSGRVQLQLGSTYLDVNMGTPCGFLQDLVSVQVDPGATTGDVSILGHVDHKLVCTPDFEMLLDST